MANDQIAPFNCYQFYGNAIIEMEIYNKKDRSIPQKLLVVILEIIIIAISYWILFDNGYNVIFSEKEPVIGNKFRHLVLFLFNCIVFFRLCITFFYLMKRRLSWGEAISLTFAFALYYIGFPLLGFKSTLSLGYIDMAGIVIFISGSFLNTFSELMRNQWKRAPQNKGHLYTGGLFKYSMHINFFGDLLWVSGFALVTRNWYAAIIPLFLFGGFIFANIPKLDAYLAKKYGREFDEYMKTTKKFIPFIY